MNKIIGKLSDKEKYLKLKKELKKEKLKEYEKESLIFDYEKMIIKQETIIKFLEIMIIPLFLTTFGIIFPTFKMELLKGVIVYIISNLIELTICAFVYYKVHTEKFFAEKILKLIKKD